MPIFIAALLGGLVQLAGSIAGRVLLALGIGFATYTGVSATLTYVNGIILTQVNSAGTFAIAALGLLQFDVILGIFIGTATAKLALSGLTGDTLKKMVTR
jgi:hypothetical protein